MYTKILIPLDGSKTAEQVVPYARTFARALRLPVELLTVVDITSLLTSTERARQFDKLAGEESRRGSAYLDEIARRFPETEVSRTVEHGTVAEVIIQKAAADPSTLIAMTTHGRSGVQRWLLGSVAEKVLRATTNPLLLVRALSDGSVEGAATLNSVVVALDGSELAECVLPMARDIATKLDMEMVLLRAYRNPYEAFGGGHGKYAVNTDELFGSVREEARDYLEEKTAELKKSGVEKIFYLLEEGMPADTIVSVVKDTPNSLVVMCSHGRSGLTRWVLGSVAETVVRHSSAPVLVVRR